MGVYWGKGQGEVLLALGWAEVPRAPSMGQAGFLAGGISIMNESGHHCGPKALT